MPWRERRVVKKRVNRRYAELSDLADRMSFHRKGGLYVAPLSRIIAQCGDVGY